MRYLPVISTKAKEVGTVLVEAESSTRYSFIGNKEIHMEESSVVCSDMKTRCHRMSSLHAAFEKLFELSNIRGRINIEMKIRDGS